MKYKVIIKQENINSTNPVHIEPASFGNEVLSFSVLLVEMSFTVFIDKTNVVHEISKVNHGNWIDKRSSEDQASQVDSNCWKLLIGFVDFVCNTQSVFT